MRIIVVPDGIPRSISNLDQLTRAFGQLEANTFTNNGAGIWDIRDGVPKQGYEFANPKYDCQYGIFPDSPKEDR
jgi:hypothetical protein